MNMTKELDELYEMLGVAFRQASDSLDAELKKRMGGGYDELKTRELLGQVKAYQEARHMLLVVGGVIE